MTNSTPPLSPPPSESCLPDLTRRLQDERDTLRAEVEELTRRLTQERSARLTLENEAQLRELELRHVQQRSAQAAQQALDKQLALEKELEDEVAMRKMAALGRNAATQKNTTLAAELKAMENQWKKELEKKEIAIAEAELAADEMQQLKADREQLVQRTESDAKRIRELWQQIEREHEVKVEALKQEVLNAQQPAQDIERSISEYQQKLAEMDEKLRKTEEEKTALQEQLSIATSEQSGSLKQKELDRLEEKSRGNGQQQLVLELQNALSECKLLTQQKETAVQERDMAVLAARKTQEALDDKVEKLLVLESKLADLLDKHRALIAQYKRSARKREAQLILRAQKLRDGKRYAEELTRLRKEEIVGYKHLIYMVNTRLTEVEQLSKAAQNSAWSLPQDARKSKTSLCIYRH